MARKVSPITQVNDSKETWKLEVRITNQWLLEKSGKITAIEMLFMDEKGDKISAIVKGFDVDKWKSILKENKTYVVQNCEVLKNEGQYKTNSHLYKLVFGKGTIVHECDLPAIPENVYHFTNFEDILSRKSSTDVLVDVIGEFVDIHQKKDTAPRRLVMVMKDQRNNYLHWTLWEHFATKMIHYLESHEGGPVIILLSLAKIKDFDGKYPITIQNSICGSKLLINEDILEIREYKDSLDSNVVYESYSQRVTQVSACSQTSYESTNMLSGDVKGLNELHEVHRESICLTVAKIDKICVGNGWSYEACSKCNKKVDRLTLPYICKCGKKNTDTVPRFRIEVMVSHNKDNAKFVLWDRECIQLVMETASNLKKQLLDEGETNPMAIPEAVDCILGKELAFKVKVTPGYKHYSVIQVAEDDKVIEAILQKIPTAEDTIMSQKGKSISSLIKEDDLTESQSLSGTADYDPALIGYFTPAKRLSDDSQCDDIPEKDLSSAQLSSTKYTKHMKTE